MVIRLTRASPGFGMIELLVVVAILSVLTIGSTFLLIRPGSDLNRISDQLGADASQARSMAMITGVDHSLVFTPDGWTVSQRSDEDWKTLTNVQPQSANFSAAQWIWILRADGSTTDLALEFSADGETRRCHSGTNQLLECR